MFLAITPDQWVGIAVAVLAGIAAHTYFGWYSYRYFTLYFKMPKWLRLTLSFGGFVTYVGYVMMDEFRHTSMMGDNTRTWKNDPENGVHILSWKEVRRLKDEGKLKVVEPHDEDSNSDHD